MERPTSRYRGWFKPCALNPKPPQLEVPTDPAPDACLEGHVLMQSELIGTYRKQKR